MKQCTKTNYYQTFGLPRTVSQTKIKLQFRKLVLQYHPDKNKDPSARRKIKEIYKAYETLSDPEKRREYDVQTFGYSFWIDNIPIKIEFYKNGLQMRSSSFEVFINGVKNESYGLECNRTNSEKASGGYESTYVQYEGSKKESDSRSSKT